MRRSTEANRRYWLLVHLMSEKLLAGKFSADSWHAYCKSRFLGADDLALPNGRTIVVPHSSAALDTAEFNDYMTRVEAWAAEHGVWLDEITEAA